MNAPDPQLDSLRLPPHSVEAEQSVLGGLLIDNAQLENISGLLGEDDFYRHDHRLLFRHICKLINLDRPADVITVHESLVLESKSDEIGGLAYLDALTRNTPSAANIIRYAEIVRERAILRKLVTFADEIASEALNPKGKEARQLLDEAESRILQVSEGSSSGSEFKEVGDLLVDVLKRIEELGEGNHGDVSGIPTGFVDLDRKTTGLHPGQLVIVAGRPAMGKTSFSMNIAEHVAIDEGLPVAVFSMEMEATQLAARMIGSIGKLDQQRMRTGRLLDEDWPKLTHAMQLLQEAQIYIDESPALSPLVLRSRARRLKRKCGKLGLIVVDYLQLMSGNALSKNDNRTAEISEISRSLKTLAKEMECPVIALSQLNRGLEQRTNKRPIMSDLRESGAIEQDADLILFIYRDEVYHPDTQDKGSAEVIIGKQRAGPIGTVRLTFAGEYTKFMNYAGPGDSFIAE